MDSNGRQWTDTDGKGDRTNGMDGTHWRRGREVGFGLIGRSGLI
jgi:hypothetical protein